MNYRLQQTQPDLQVEQKHDDDHNNYTKKIMMMMMIGGRHRRGCRAGANVFTV